MRSLNIVLAIITLASCGGDRRQPAIIPAARSAMFPPVAYGLLAGGTWSSSAVTGRVIVLDVWATYCTPCKKAFPKLDRLAAAFPDIAVIGLSVDDDDAVVHAFLREVPATFPIARDPKRTVEAAPLAIRALPTVIVVDRVGRVRFRAEKMAEGDYDALFDLVSALRAE